MNALYNHHLVLMNAGAPLNHPKGIRPAGSGVYVTSMIAGVLVLASGFALYQTTALSSARASQEVSAVAVSIQKGFYEAYVSAAAGMSHSAQGAHTAMFATESAQIPQYRGIAADQRVLALVTNGSGEVQTVQNGLKKRSMDLALPADHTQTQFNLVKTGQSLAAAAASINTHDILAAVVGAYQGIGAAVYGAERGAMGAYAGLLARTGSQALVLGAAVRDGVAVAPQNALAATVTVGRTVQNATAAVISNYVSLIYETRNLSYTAFYKSFAFINSSGSYTLALASAAPRYASANFIALASAPYVASQTVIRKINSTVLALGGASASAGSELASAVEGLHSKSQFFATALHNQFLGAVDRTGFAGFGSGASRIITANTHSVLVSLSGLASAGGAFAVLARNPALIPFSAGL